MSLKDLKNSTKLTDLTTSQVKELQQLLVQANYAITIDGILGPQTKQAFKLFKESHRLTLPDMIGPTTLKHLIKSSKINSEGLNLIKEFEGFYSNAYLCPSSVATIG